MQQEWKEMLQTLYEKHARVLRFAAQSKQLPLEEADDAVQDTFCSFIEAYGDCFAGWNERQIKAALMRILYNRCADYYREKIRHPDTSIEGYTQEEEYRIITELIVPDVEEYVAAKAELLQVREGISAMSPAMREVAMLCLVESRSVKETSEILKINEATCRMRLSRARKYLTEWIENPAGKKSEKRK